MIIHYDQVKFILGYQSEAFLSEQCKEIEENNTMGKTRALFKKNSRYQGNSKCKDGHNEEQRQYGPNRYLAEAKQILKQTYNSTQQKILRRGGKNIQKELYKKDLHDPDNHDGVITHLEPDILECEVRWDLESITTNKTS